MKKVQTALGFIAFIAFCLGCAFLLLLPGNPLIWKLCWELSALTTVILAVWRRDAVLYYFFHRSTRYGANLFLIVILGFGILASVNYIAANYRKRLDLTSIHRFTLSEQTLKVIRDLRAPIKIYHFTQMGPETGQAQDLMDMYKHSSSKVKVEQYPINSNPTLARSLGIEKVTQGEQVFVITQSSGSPENDAKIKPVTVRGVSEEKLTNGILRLIKSQDQVVYFLTGHGERNWAEPTRADSLSDLKKLIENEVYTVKALQLDNEPQIPADAAVLIIAGPKADFLPNELALVRKWVEDGGRLIVAFDLDMKAEGLPRGAQQIADWFKSSYGLSVGNHLLVDITSKLYQMDGQVLVASADSPSHEITKDFPRTQIQMGYAWHFYFPFAVRMTEEKQVEGIRLTSLVKTSPAAWEESSWSQVKSGVVKYDKGVDTQASMNLSYAIESTKKAPWRIVTFATSGFMTNGVINAKNDKDIILNSINWLSNQEGQISIREKEFKDTTLSIDANLYNFIVLILMIVIPISILGAGIWGWMGRRAK